VDWQIIKLFLKACAPLAVFFYLIVIFGFRLFTEDKEEDI
jgi:hypothetical protein